MTDIDVSKWLFAAFATVLGWIGIAYRNNNSKHEGHHNKLSEHEKELAIIKIQMTTMSAKIDDVIELGNDIKDGNRIILKALSRNNRKAN